MLNLFKKMLPSMFVIKNKNQKLQEAKLERRYARYLMKKINNA